MLVAVVSDIHANLQAYEAVLDAAANVGVSELWCLGDIVGYGANPEECLRLTEAHANVSLAGNHDLAVSGALATSEFSRGAALAAEWTRKQLSEQSKQYLAGLDPRGEREGIGLFHGSPREPIWEYVLSALQAELCMDIQAQRIALVGHSHVALSFNRQEGEPATGGTCEAGKVHEIPTGEWIINPGSVGQPRDGDPRAAWLLLDLVGQLAIWQRTEYDIAAAAKAIASAGLPASLAERLYHGQ